jgi:alpha-L-rhamnosidase
MPLGIGAERPRLSWQLPSGSSHQTAYRVELDGVDMGWVHSDDQMWVAADVEPTSGRRVDWRVRVRTDQGESDWSELSWWEHGLLHPGDWTAVWIGPVDAADAPRLARPVHQLAGGVELPSDIVSARLHITAHGIYEAFINGVRVGDEELAPGWTAYRSRLQVQTHDVTDLVRAGPNVLGALLSDGWWRGQNSVSRRTDDYGTTTELLAQLIVTTSSGAVVRFGTDATWRTTPSHITAADLISGEVWDLRRRVDWSTWGSWSHVRVETGGLDVLVSPVGPPVRRIEEIRPRSVHSIGPRTWIVDLGQNINGWVRLTRLGAAGNEVTLTYGEWLDENGDVTQHHLYVATMSEEDRRIPFQTDRVVSAGVDADVFEPRHSTKGFQFVRVEGLDEPFGPDDVTGIVVHSDLTPRGSFACSDPRLDAVHRIAEWSFRGNACDIPTDCPTRERAGWTGDWQIYVPTASFLYDVGGFSDKWLRDLAADQRPDGKVTNLVPESHPADGREPSFWPYLEGSAGWSDAAVHVPWVHHHLTADTGLLQRQYPSMTAHVDWAAATASNGRHASRIERSVTPAEHERFIWDTGWHYGEWLEAGESLDDTSLAALTADHGPVATAYLYRSASELAEIAGLLGHDDDAERYGTLAADVLGAWRTEFLGPDGSVTPHTQAGYVRALEFGLLPDDLRPAAVDRLVQLVHAAGHRLTTGFLSTPFLLPVLADHGHLDLAYELLLQPDVPGWVVMVERGATTVWEEWEGIDAQGRPHASLNHYSKGAVITFLHEYVAGMRPLEPGWRHHEIRPRPGGGLTWARAHHDCPYGRIDSSWTLADGDFDIDIVVPPGTRCRLVLPDGSVESIAAGQHHRRCHPTGPTV